MGRSAHFSVAGYGSCRGRTPDESRPIIWFSRVTSEQQATYLNALPLIALGAVYMAAGLSLVPSLVRERWRIRELDLALALGFPSGALAAVIFGSLMLGQDEPVGGNGWLGLIAILVAAVPAIAFFARFQDRWLLLTAPGRAREVEALTTSERQVRAAGRVAGAASFGDAAGTFVAEAIALVDAEFGALLMIEAEGVEAYGVVGRSRGRDVDWMHDVRLDLRNEPSGVASAYHDAAAFAVYDAVHSRRVSRRLAERSNVKSTAYVPLLFERRVIGVLVLGSIDAPRAFTAHELELVQRLASDIAGVLERLRSTSDVGAEIERERIVGTIATRFRSAGGVDEVLDIAVREVGRALGVQRCFVRLDGAVDSGELSRPTVRAQWQAEQLPPIVAQTAARLPVANLAVREQRTIGLADASVAPELDDESLGGRETLLRLGARAVAAAPITVFGRTLGVFSVHRTQPGPWAPGHLALIEAVAREIGFAYETANLLSENMRRLERERALFRLASSLAETVSLQSTLDALAHAAADVHSAAATAVLLARGETFDLAASFALPGAVREALASGGLREPALELASSERRVLASASLAGDTRFTEEWRQVLATARLRSALLIPVEDPRADAAALVLVLFEDERRIVDDDLELARHLASAARAALERAELFEAERTSRSLSQQLARTGALLATELDPAAILDEVVAEAPLVVGADACVVFTLDGDELVVAAAAAEDAEAVLGARTAIGPWLSGEVAQSRRPVILEDARSAAPAGADPVLDAGYAAYIGLPLVGAEAGLHGVLALYARSARSWRPEIVEALLALAANTSAALSRAELYQRVALEKERSAAILENIADGIVAVDRDGKVVLWNKAAEEITGVPASEALGAPPQRALGRTLEGEGLVAIPSGARERWLSVTEAVMRDPAGLVAGRIYAFRDISSERFVEQMKSEFVTTVSHELRGPLTSIYGFAETLLREDVLFGEDERKIFLGYISSESERLTQIVDQLLNVARLDTGDLYVNLAPTEVGPLLTEVVANASVGGNDHRFVVDVPSEPIAAEADVDKLRQVLSQLIDNAVKYSPGGGTVKIGARRNDDRVQFEVEDEGIGIPKSERDRIFRKFYRASAGGGHETVGGTGVGLFIVRGLVNAMGGRIWVESAEGEGSRFAFELPAARV
jgi:two-component system phosphate regulon sensor histidine kinase PhoR